MESPRVVVLVNGSREGGAAVRARGLFDPLRNRLDIVYSHRDAGRVRAFRAFVAQIHDLRPMLVYVVDVGVANAGAAITARLLLRTPFVVDTGDLAYELARSTGRHGYVGRGIVRVVEGLALRLACAIVVRGTYHKEFLERAGRRSVHLIRDGVDTRSRPRGDGALRRKLGVADAVCVGMMGSLRWNRRRRVCYGWDVVEAMALLEPELPVRAVVIGDGDGLPYLRQRARELGVSDRIRFVGRIPYADVPGYLNVFDVAVSTQTNDRVGRVRTTGKLPEYMAAGCYVLATDVGEARLLLPPEMRLPYAGSSDAEHPRRLANRIAEIAQTEPERLREAAVELITRARDELDYQELSVRLRNVLATILERETGARSKIALRGHA